MSDDDRKNAARKEAARRELQDYRRQKTAERDAQAGPARAERDPEWTEEQHLDPERATDRPRRDGAAKDAEGQAERGKIDQLITSKGYTETK